MNGWGLLASISISFFASFLFAWFLYWLDLYEKEPFLLLGGVFLWGAVVSAGAAFIANTLSGLGVYVLTGSEAASNLTIGTLIAPFFEEIFKGFAVFLVFIIFRKEFDSILDGIVYAGVAALGFAATENAFYIYTYGFLEDGWEGFRSLSLIRIGLVGWQHPFYTAFFGIGLALARNNRSFLIKIGAPAIGLFAAITTHGLHNLLASLFPGVGGMAFTSILDWLGWLAMLGFIIIIMFIEKQHLKTYLQPEIQLGTLTDQQFTQAISFIKIQINRLSALFKGKYAKTTQFYRSAAELALKKRQLDRLGDEKGNRQTVNSLRAKVRDLSHALQA